MGGNSRAELVPSPCMGYRSGIIPGRFFRTCVAEVNTRYEHHLRRMDGHSKKSRLLLKVNIESRKMT